MDLASGEVWAMEMVVDEAGRGDAKIVRSDGPNVDDIERTFRVTTLNVKNGRMMVYLAAHDEAAIWARATIDISGVAYDGGGGLARGSVILRDGVGRTLFKILTAAIGHWMKRVERSRRVPLHPIRRPCAFHA